MANVREKARALAGDLLDRVVQRATDLGVTVDHAVVAGGGGTVMPDCGSIVWVRVGNVMPATTSGQPTGLAPAGQPAPSWAITLEVGAADCVQTIGDDGEPMPDDYVSAVSERDADLRLAVLCAVVEDFPAIMAARGVDSAGMSALTTMGPDGGVSGGYYTITMTTQTLVTD